MACERGTGDAGGYKAAGLAAGGALVAREGSRVSLDAVAQAAEQASMDAGAGREAAAEVAGEATGLGIGTFP